MREANPVTTGGDFSYSLLLSTSNAHELFSRVASSSYVLVIPA